MKNSQLAKAFANGIIGWTDMRRRQHGSNLFVEGRAIFSYGNHFPVAIRFDDCFIVNGDKYSPSTSRHKTCIVQAIYSTKKPMIQSTTEQMKELLKYVDRWASNDLPAEDNWNYKKIKAHMTASKI